MARGRPTRNYLMLDKNDITNVCGVISRKGILKEIPSLELDRILALNGTYFRDKYILVEDDFGEETNKKFKEVKINETKYNLYYVSHEGNAFSVSKKTGKKNVLNPFMHKNVAYVKIGRQQWALKMLVAKAFISEVERYDVIMHKNDNIFDCSVDNLVVIKHSVYAKKTGALAKSQRVGLFENDILIREWSSARKCAKDLFCSYQTVMSTANGKIKNPMFDVRWL